MSEARAWLACYDIAEPRRLRQVHRYLVKRAIAVQYSVFAGVWTEGELGRVLEGIGHQISAKRDDVRVYPLPQWGAAEVRGPMVEGEGIWLLTREFAVIRAAALAWGGTMGKGEKWLRRAGLDCDMK
jgi:CRISPR-associated protein Cas2